MSYFTDGGKFVDAEEVTLAASAARTATAAGTTKECGHHTSARLRIDVTAIAPASATSTLDVAIQVSRDGTEWRTAAGTAVTQITGDLVYPAGVTLQYRTFLTDRYIRPYWTLGASATSVTFAITGELV